MAFLIFAEENNLHILQNFQKAEGEKLLSMVLNVPTL